MLIEDDEGGCLDMDESMQSLEPEDMESEFLQESLHETEVDGMEDNGLESEWNFFVENLLPECSQEDHGLQQETVQDGDPVAEMDKLLKQLSQMEATVVQQILGHVESDLLQDMLHSIREQETHHTATFHHTGPSDIQPWNIPQHVNTRAMEDQDETRSSIRLILQKQEDPEGRQIITRNVVQDDYESMYSFQQCDTQEHSGAQQLMRRNKVVKDEAETKSSIPLWKLQMQKEFEARQKVALQMFKDCSQTMTWRWARWPPESLRRMSPMTVHIDIKNDLSANLVRNASVILEREPSVGDDPAANFVGNAPVILEPERTEIPRGAQSHDLVGLQQQVQQHHQILSQQPLPAELDANEARYGQRTPTESNVVTTSQNSNPAHCGIRQEEAPDSPQKCSRTTKAQLAEIPRQVACTLLARTPQDVDSNVIRRLFTQIDKIIIQALHQDMQSGSREKVPPKAESLLLPPLLDSTSILDCTGVKPLWQPIPQRQHAQESGGQERIASQVPPQRSRLQGSHDFPEKELKAPQVPPENFRMDIRELSECESLAPAVLPERIRHPRDFIDSMRTSATKSSRQIESKALPSQPDASLYYHQIEAPHLKQVPEPPPKFRNVSLSYSEYRNVGRTNVVHPFNHRKSRQPANVEELFFHGTLPDDELFGETMRDLNSSDVHSNHRPVLFHNDNFPDISQGIQTYRPNSGFCREPLPQLRFPDVDSSDLVHLMSNSGLERQFDELHQMMMFNTFQEVAKKSEHRRSSKFRVEPDSHGFETTFGRPLPQEWRYPQKHYPTHDPPNDYRYYGVHELAPDFADSNSYPSTSDQSESNEFRGLMAEDDPNFEGITETSEMNSPGYNRLAQIEETNPYYLDSHFDPFRPPVYNFRESPSRSEPESIMWQHFASQNHHDEITDYMDITTSDYTLRDASRQTALDQMSQFNVSQLSHREIAESGEQLGHHHLDVYLDSELQGLELATSSFLRTLRQHAVQNTTPPRNRLRANRQKAFSLHALSDDTSDLWTEDSSDSRETEGLLSEQEDSQSLRSASSNETQNESLPDLQSSPQLNNCIFIPESSLQCESSNLPQNTQPPMDGFQRTSPLEGGKDHETAQTASKPRRRLPPPRLHVEFNPLPLNSSRGTTSKTPPNQTSAQVENPSHRTRVNMSGKMAPRDGVRDLPLPDSSFVHSKDAAQAQPEAVVRQSANAVEARCGNCPSKPPNSAQFHNPSRSVKHTIFGLLVLAGGLYLVENRDQIELQSICAAEATAEAWRWLGGTLLKMSNGEFDN